MHIVSSITLLILLFMNPAGFAHAENWLQGQVLENHGGTKKPAAGAQVWIVNVGNPYLTTSDGGYRVLVPDAYRIGQSIKLYVKRKGWAIATPVGGKVELTQDFTSDILLSPEASSVFLSSAQLDTFLESLPEKLKSHIRPDGKAGEADPSQIVEEYATEHGLPEREVSVKIADLVKQYEQSSDIGKQCLAATYRKNFEQASILCKQNATSKVDLLKKKRQEMEALSNRQSKSDRSVEPPFAYGSGEMIFVTDLSGRFRANPEPRGRRDMFLAEAPPGKSSPAHLEEARRQLIKLTEEVVQEFKATGDTYYANYQFDNALEAYTEGLSHVEKNDLPTLWADMQLRIGMANSQIGIRTRGAAIWEHLSNAVKRYRAAQTVYTMALFPEAWATIETNLAAVFKEQSIRTSGEASTRLLAQAVEAYKAALSFSLTNSLLMHLNVPNTLERQVPGANSMSSLQTSLTAYRNLVTAVLKTAFPEDWARTQVILGTMLSDQGALVAGADSMRLFQDAEAAYRGALTVYTKESLPQTWAMIQNNLGAVLLNQSARTSGEASTRLLAQAIEAQWAALTIYTKAALPQPWAKTQVFLGMVLNNQVYALGV